jgi:uroporphyrinogen decarboxylase
VKSREIVKRCLKFENPERMPRDTWFLPWANIHVPEGVKQLQLKYPSDFIIAEGFYKTSPLVKGDMYAVGLYTDEWGVVWENVQAGVIGEIKNPILKDQRDFSAVAPPYDILPDDLDDFRKAVNEFCAGTDKFVIAGCLPRPWERYQFLRGTENAMMDVMTIEDGVTDILKTIHKFFMTEVELWSSTNIDGIWFMDDWGSQTQLLIPPQIWRALFKPMYKDYCDLAHKNGKYALMHSDGCIIEIYKDIIEVGVDAINSQLFCMDIADLGKRAKGKITFWGEIDRQHVLASNDPEVGREAVREIAECLYDPRGGVIAQFEFGAGANPETAMAIFDEWDRIQEAM